MRECKICLFLLHTLLQRLVANTIFQRNGRMEGKERNIVYKLFVEVVCVN